MSDGRSSGPSGPSVVVLATAVVALAAALTVPFGPTGVAFSLLVAVTPATLLLLAVGRGAGWWLAGSIGASLALVGGGFVLLLATRDGDPLENRLWGLPLALGIEVWVLALLPLVVLGLLYGLSFGAWRPTAAQIERLRDLAREESSDG